MRGKEVEERRGYASVTLCVANLGRVDITSRQVNKIGNTNKTTFRTAAHGCIQTKEIQPEGTRKRR